ncbi:2-oxo acid dehydrogenase subunit E2 [Mycoplasmopsis gallinarum]|uniref:Dihydrolipoamide acetyltransferase component ofpyruvate dehydrogenase complex n=1 Tax=Mycoplasmopsis gallinarum TaxID=29557 RepID=A0A168R7T5_9BACT|nr:2-oxo acid dehydrogenase subunit E2 [Mycoplasmopsis gallinarum]OAB48689.1 Dihydrolipoamide acetyltransferase component ofpyruvate dehydrogenase complex [Mycoplasmopsis gallinarum]
MSEIIEVKPLEAKEVKLPPIRKAIAKNLKNAMNQVAYCSLVQKVDATNLWNYRLQVKDKVLAEKGVKLTFLSWIIKAITIALSEYPMFAAKVDEENGIIKFPDSLNIGIAVDTPYGLVVPVIKNADKLSIVEIQQEIVRLATLARDKKLTMADMQGGSYTITNVGSVGVLWGTPIMNYPEIAITAVGAIEDQLTLVDKEIVVKKAMYLSIAADHRWVDGADMGRFNGRVKELLEQPEKLGEL